MSKRSRDTLTKWRLSRLKRNLQLGRQNIHIKKYTLGAKELLIRFGRTDVFCPESGREQTVEKKVRRQKQYERFLDREAEIMRQERLRYSELGKFISGRELTRE